MVTFYVDQRFHRQVEFDASVLEIGKQIETALGFLTIRAILRFEDRYHVDLLGKPVVGTG